MKQKRWSNLGEIKVCRIPYVEIFQELCDALDLMVIRKGEEFTLKYLNDIIQVIKKSNSSTTPFHIFCHNYNLPKNKEKYNDIFSQSFLGTLDEYINKLNEENGLLSYEEIKKKVNKNISSGELWTLNGYVFYNVTDKIGNVT